MAAKTSCTGAGGGAIGFVSGSIGVSSVFSSSTRLAGKNPHPPAFSPIPIYQYVA